MELDYHSPKPKESLVEDWVVLLFRLLAAYFIISVLTLPLLNALWYFEVPLFALIQFPKTALAGWLCIDVLMPAIRGFGLSRGSFSPDYVMARPYALALAYVLGLGLVFVPVLTLGKMTPLRWRWACIVLVAAAIDFVLTPWLAGRPGLTIY